MSLQKKLLVFHLIATLGYSFTGLAAFFSIEATFHKISYLGIALCLRTFSACAVGYMVRALIKKMGIRNLFKCMLALGIVALACMYYGFSTYSFLFVSLGIILNGVVAALSMILLTIVFRLLAEDNASYRKYSGSREFIFGLARLVVCLITPLLLFVFNIDRIFLINAAIYFVGIVFFIGLDLKLLEQAKQSEKRVKMHLLLLKSKDTWIYVFQMSSSWMLIALIPLLSSSNQIGFFNEMPAVLRQSFWSVEAITMILSSMIYLLIKQLYANEMVKAVLMLNSFCLFLFLFFPSFIMAVVIAMLISMLIMASFYIFRDNYVIAAGENREIIDVYSAFSSVIRDLISSISPIILTGLFIKLQLNTAIIVIFMLQFSLYMGYLIFSRVKAHSMQPDSG